MNDQSFGNVYDANDTMRLLGHQYYDAAYTPEACKQMDEIVDARRFTTTRETALDMFMLGFIHGKRAERRRRKRAAEKNTVTPMCIQLSEQRLV